MPFYMKQGKIPKKRHITFYKDNGKDLYREELFSTHGFSNMYSNKYHHNMPCKVLDIKPIDIEHGEVWENDTLENTKLDSTKTDGNGNFVSSRKKLFFNSDVALYTAKVTEETEDFYRNSYADEVVFIHEGEGTFYSEYGTIEFTKWDYFIIPKGTTYQLKFKSYDNVRMFVTESATMVEIPKHYKTASGQLLESAPYCERDIRTPELQAAIVEKGEFNLINKFGDKYQNVKLEWHPYDLVGWDGACYPWAFNIQEFAPIVGKIHLPPPIHLLLVANNFVICNFVPRLYDFHPESIPAPYYHSNIDSDEILYYVEGDFMSRTGIGAGYITYHPKGMPHGPQPGKTEQSVGKKEAYEYAVMVDTFAPLKMTEHVKNNRDKDYYKSWLE